MAGACAEGGREISQRVTLYAVFGHPIGHSLSPDLHNAAFRAENTPCFYLPVDVLPDQLMPKLDAFRTLGGMGVNLTRPLKEIIVPQLMAQSEWVDRTQAANTVVWRDGGWVGDNTDVQALLMHVAPSRHPSRPALVIGSGGAARSSVAGLKYLGYDVHVAARHPESVDFHDRVQSFQGIADPHDWAVIVNATPLGQQHESMWETFPEISLNTLVVDWVYRPRNTPLLQKAEQVGAPTLDGLTLLVDQARMAWKFWFGQMPSAETMWAAVAPWA